MLNVSLFLTITTNNINETKKVVPPGSKRHTIKKAFGSCNASLFFPVNGFLPFVIFITMQTCSVFKWFLTKVICCLFTQRMLQKQRKTRKNRTGTKKMRTTEVFSFLFSYCVCEKGQFYIVFSQQLRHIWP